MVRGETKQEFDKDGNLYIDQDPKHFVYVLNSLRVRYRYPMNFQVPKEALSYVQSLAGSLGMGGGQFKSLE